MLSCHSLEILYHFIFELVKSEGTRESKQVWRGAMPAVSGPMGGLQPARMRVGSASGWSGGQVTVAPLWLAGALEVDGNRAVAAVPDATGGGSSGSRGGGAALGCTPENALGCLRVCPQSWSLEHLQTSRVFWHAGRQVCQQSITE